MTESPKQFREWDRRQWAGNNSDEASYLQATSDVQTEPAGETPRWSKTQWVGEDASGNRPARQTPDEMPEGEPGLSGSRHNPGVQHWARVERTQDSRGN
jgi:hypothetical protein